LKSYWGKEVSDPIKVAQVALRLAASDSLPAHLSIGSDAVRFAGEAEKTREAAPENCRPRCAFSLHVAGVAAGLFFLSLGLFLYAAIRASYAIGRLAGCEGRVDAR
jgi:hypothetical protein